NTFSLTDAAVLLRTACVPNMCTWGARKLAARVNRLNVDGSAFSRGLADPTRSAREARAWAVGLNWYVNRNVKYLLNYERTTFTGGAAAGGNRRAANAFLVRSQVPF